MKKDDLQNHENNWHPCQAGQVHRLVGRLKNRRLLRALRRDFTVAVVLFAFVLSGYVVADTWPNQPVGLGGVVCFEVSRIADTIVNAKLPPEVEVCVRRHLAICAHCRKHIEELRIESAEGSDREIETSRHDASPLMHVAAYR